MRELQRPLCVAAVFKEAESRWRIDTAKSASRDLRLLLQCIREDRRPDRRRTEERPRIVQHERGVAQVDVRLAIRSAALAILCDTKELKIYRLRPSRTAIDIVQNTVRGREGELAGNREAEAAGLDDCAFARHHLDPVAWRGVAWRMGRGSVLGATR